MVRVEVPDAFAVEVETTEPVEESIKYAVEMTANVKGTIETDPTWPPR